MVQSTTGRRGYTGQGRRLIASAGHNEWCFNFALGIKQFLHLFKEIEQILHTYVSAELRVRFGWTNVIIVKY